MEKIVRPIANRHYPLPEGSWKYYQEWHNVLMLHYLADRSYLTELLPQGVALDTFNGKAWVSLCGFSVKKLRPRFLGSLLCLPSFNEVNLRTYVIRDGLPGIYLLSIEADAALDVLLPRLLLGIPYVKAEVHRGNWYFLAQHQGRGSKLEVEYFPKGATIKDRLDYWLTERHALYVKSKGKLYRFDIHHKEWKLRDVKIKGIIENYTSAAAFTSRPDRQHFSKKISIVLRGRKIVSR